MKGAALFPLSNTGSVSFSTSKLRHALDVLGIGALPFLPANTRHVEEWLEELLALAPEDLAEPGPPFGWVDEKQRRALKASGAS